MPLHPPTGPAQTRKGAGGVPSRREDQEQVALMQWARLMERRIPELEMLFHIPNGGHRNKVVAQKLKAQGVKAGVLDLFLPVPRWQYHGLWIELKVGKNKPTAAQKWWINRLCEQGYRVRVCWSMDEARDAILDYLGNVK